VRFGKGSRGPGPKTRLVPAINQVDELLDWWMVDVRHQFGGDYTVADAPLLPAERAPDPDTGWCRRVHGQTLRDGAGHIRLGHSWLSTTTRYIHVDAEHVERAWLASNQRTMAQLGRLKE
jgi:hypothetical protein